MKSKLLAEGTPAAERGRREGRATSGSRCRRGSGPAWAPYQKLQNQPSLALGLVDRPENEPPRILFSHSKK